MSPDAPHKPGTDEEPELTQEEAVPSDGSDAEGEDEMRKVRNPKLEDVTDDDRQD